MIWRLILDGAARGAWNMAVDEALLLCHAAHETPPTLRFYDWQPACVSLGRLQKSRDARDLDIEAIEKLGFDMVRRPTGGRAVLHQHEITYCIVVRMDLLPSGCQSVIDSYRWLSEGFAVGLRDLGINPTLAASPVNPATGTANCFSSAAQCDFVADGRKLIGAAQYRKNGAVLQHGSLLMGVDEAAWQAVLGSSMENAVSLREMGIMASRETIIDALCCGLERSLHVSLELGVLHSHEISLASRLHTAKYAAAKWE